MNESIAKFVGGLIGVGVIGVGCGGWEGGIFTGTSLVVSKNVPANFEGFDFFTPKNPDFENSSWIFFHLEKFLKFFDKIRRIISI